MKWIAQQMGKEDFDRISLTQEGIQRIASVDT
jgi:hypothetical protein